MTMGLTGCGIFGTGGSSKSKTEPILPHDREEISTSKDVRSYTPEEIRKGVVKGDWSIKKVYGVDAVGERAPFLKFVPDRKMVYGNNGCNTLNARYLYNPADSTLRFENVASTLMACSKTGITDALVNRALNETRYYTWKVVDTDYYLDLYNETHQCVMTMVHQNFDFLNGTWLITSINDMKVDVPDMKLVIDVDEGKLHGNTGCNIINGVLDINMEEANSISFSAIGMTRMACPDMNYETALVVALEEVTTAKPVSAGEVLLFDNAGKQVLSLKRTTDK